MKVLMVCHGNICRSPLAEGILRDKANKARLNWEVDSAGTNGYDPGCPPHRFSQKVAKLYGIDICDQKCRHFVKEDMERFDKIYVMDDENYFEVQRIAADKWNENKVDYLLNELYPTQNEGVPDPWFEGEEGFHEVYKLLDKACDAVITNYAGDTQ